MNMKQRNNGRKGLINMTDAAEYAESVSDAISKVENSYNNITILSVRKE